MNNDEEQARKMAQQGQTAAGHLPYIIIHFC